MVKIRLARAGAKKKPFYHVVATDKASPRDGRYIERLGFFNPVAVGGEVPLRLNVERIEYWQGQGAQLSERVANLVKDFKKKGLAEAAAAAPAEQSQATENAEAQPAPSQDQTAD